jgi:hypothetical protein
VFESAVDAPAPMAKATSRRVIMGAAPQARPEPGRMSMAARRLWSCRLVPVICFDRSCHPARCGWLCPLCVARPVADDAGTGHLTPSSRPANCIAWLRIMQFPERRRDIVPCFSCPMDAHTRVRMLAGGMIVAGLLGGILALWILPKETSTNGRTTHAHDIGAEEPSKVR